MTNSTKIEYLLISHNPHPVHQAWIKKGLGGSVLKLSFLKFVYKTSRRIPIIRTLAIYFTSLFYIPLIPKTKNLFTEDYLCLFLAYLLKKVGKIENLVLLDIGHMFYSLSHSSKNSLRYKFLLYLLKNIDYGITVSKLNQQYSKRF